MALFDKQVAALSAQLVAWRRDFHRHPELAFEETRTAGIVAATLDGLGFEVQRGIGQTGVIGLLEGEQDGPTVLVRADMDALPIQEANEVPYVSTIANRMHACGHDAHTAIALGAATILAESRHKLAGRVKFVFQPAEEIGAGAKAMIDDGALDNPRPDVALGLHMWNTAPVGQIVVSGGPLMSGAESFTLRIAGQGGHAALPHETRDPIVAAAQIIVASQTVVSRNVSPLDAGVISFTQITGGDAFNVIPNGVELNGSIRSFNSTVRETLISRLEMIATGIAAAMNCTAELEILRSVPPLVNDPAVAQQLAGRFRQADQSLEIIDELQVMVSEDMGHFLNAVPGVFFLVGSANAAKELTFPHHHPRFDIDEAALQTGMTLLTEAVAHYVWRD
ncbi:MAG: amidohydrolase [Chloroflexi bacterium]|nr:amidohydrolase [Chloroflexota bacterium]